MKRTGDDKVYTSKRELMLYLQLLDTHPAIQQFLDYDKFYCLADKYLIAMVFIYFKRAQLAPKDYTYLNFFAGLCLAQSMEEDVYLGSAIYPWALGKNQASEDLSHFFKLKKLLWQAMDYRAAVSHHCCLKLISLSQDHSVWRRKRLPSYLNSYYSKSFLHKWSDSEDDDDIRVVKGN